VSTLDPLVDRLKSSDADEIRVEPGRRIYMVSGKRRLDVSREPVKPRAIEAICLELLSPEDLIKLSSKPKTVPYERGGQSFDVEFSRPGRDARIVVRKPQAARRSELTGAFASVEVSAVRTERRPEPARPEPARPEPARPEPARPAERPVRGSPPRAEPRRPQATGGSREIDELLQMMVSQNASDLHLSSGCQPVLRVDGRIRFLEERPTLDSSGIEALLRPIFPERWWQEFQTSRDVDFAYEVEGLARFRVNVFSDRKGMGAVFRQIPIEVIPADKLGLPPAILNLCHLSKGLVIVTGPTGSGKSTTLAAMVDFINKNRDDHIITIEDPIEFVHENLRCLVNQREVANHTMSFKAALRAALREDPDIVLVGEMRDLETISIALETAETGHLVFGTLHTTTAVSTVDRIIDQFPPDQQAQVRVMLAESLKGVVAQVLCPKKGGGRVAAMEILLVNHAVSSLIRESKSYQIPSVMQTRKAEGMVQMNDSLLMLVTKGLVEPKDAYIKAVDKSSLVGMFERHGIGTGFLQK
jgi:twitching motility protein PilT